jgi:hypothetical protein
MVEYQELKVPPPCRSSLLFSFALLLLLNVLRRVVVARGLLILAKRVLTVIFSIVLDFGCPPLSFLSLISAGSPERRRSHKETDSS